MKTRLLAIGLTLTVATAALAPIARAGAAPPLRASPR
jgi:hypothetical protein